MNYNLRKFTTLSFFCEDYLYVQCIFYGFRSKNEFERGFWWWGDGWGRGEGGRVGPGRLNIFLIFILASIKHNDKTLLSLTQWKKQTNRMGDRFRNFF